VNRFPNSFACVSRNHGIPSGSTFRPFCSDIQDATRSDQTRDIRNAFRYLYSGQKVTIP
jgi:hypothetical protein